MDKRILALGAVVLGLIIVGLVWMNWGGGADTMGAENASSTAQEVSQKKRTLPKPKPLNLSEPAQPQTKADKEAVGEVKEEGTESASKEEVVQPKRPLGAMSRGSIDDGIRDFMPDIRQCYQEALKEVPDLEGRIMVKFTIKGQDEVGRVIKVSIKDADFDDAPLEDCIMDVVESIDFDPPQGGGIVIVSYPFLFEPG